MPNKNPLYVEQVNVRADLTVAPAANGEIRYVTGTGFQGYAEGSVVTFGGGAATAYDDIGDPDANSTIAFTSYTNDWTFTGTGGFFGITANSLTTGNAFSVTANALTSGSMVYLESSAAGMAGEYIRCYDGAADDFVVGANGAMTIAGSAAATDAITVTAGDVTLADGHLNLAADSRKLSFGAAESTDSYIEFDGSDLLFFDSTLGVAKTLSQLSSGFPSDPTITGNVTITDGKLTWTDAADEVAGAWTFAGTSNNDITWSSAVTSANALAITADALTSGSMVYLESSAAGMSGEYLRCYDGAADDFSIGAAGLTTIAGAAAGTDSLVLTLGTLQVTDGNLDMDEGKLEIDTTTDETTYVKRNQGTVSGPVFEIEETNTGSDQPALLLDHNGTGNAMCLQISHDGDLAALEIAAGAARTGNVINIPMANQLAQTALDITGAVTGTSGEGVVHVDVTGVLAGDAIRVDSTGANASTSSLFKGISTGQNGAATNGIVAHFQDTGAAQATSYTVYIDSTNNEALKVDAGAVVFDESLTVGTTLAVTGATTLDTVLFDDFTEVVTGTNVIAAAESGSVFFLASATEFVSTLPAVAAGLHFTFVVTAAPAAADYTIVTDSSANIIIGQATNAAGAAGDTGTTDDTISFVDGQSVVGDIVELWCDGTNWIAHARTAVAAGVTFTTAS